MFGSFIAFLKIQLQLHCTNIHRIYGMNTKTISIMKLLKPVNF